MTAPHLALHPLSESVRPLETVPGSGEHPSCPVPARSSDLTEYLDGALCESVDTVAVEEPLRLLVSGHREITLMRTPGDDAHLITGHLFSLGLIHSAGDILDMTVAESGPEPALVRLRPMHDQCGITPLPDSRRISPETIFRLRDSFEERQKLYHSTGSTHAAALFGKNDELLAYGEDVSRHCAFDKAVGRALANNRLTRVNIAMLTSRLACELTTKAAIAGIPILCGFSAATSAGMEFARKNDITLIGRIRKDTFRIYANAWRLRP